MQTAAIGVGVLMQCATSALFFVLLFFNPYAPGGYVSSAEGTLQVAALQIGLAAAGLAVAFWRKPFMMLLIGILQFVPTGFYLLGTPGIFRWIGISNLGFLTAAICVLLIRERQGIQS